MTVAVCNQQVQVALEYERQPKGSWRYEEIRSDIDGERRVNRFLYLFPDYKLLWFVHALFRRSAQSLYFALVGDFRRDLLQTHVVDPQMRFLSLEEALQ